MNVFAVFNKDTSFATVDCVHLESTSRMNAIKIQEDDICKRLMLLNVYKFPGDDNLYPRVLTN